MAAVVTPISAERAKYLLQLWDLHVATEFTEKSADAAVATMVAHSTVNHVPTMTGGSGTEGLRQFYAKHFIPKMPAGRQEIRPCSCQPVMRYVRACHGL
jgi:hypothetical protein